MCRSNPLPTSLFPFSTLVQSTQTNHLPRRSIDCSTERERGNQSRFVLENDVQSIGVFLGHLETSQLGKSLGDEAALVPIQMALREALVNAIFHGNLELSSELKEQDQTLFFEMAEQRREQSPYRDRRVRVEVRETRTEITFTISDDGRGFDPCALPDPTDAENLEKTSGRGLFLIRSFMDEVHHNPKGNEITIVKRFEPRSAAA